MLNKFLLTTAAAVMLVSCGGDDAAETVTPKTPAGEAVELENPGAARWVVRDEDSTMVLFGTFHILPDGIDWRTDGFDEALSDAGEVWFEVLPSELGNQAKVQGLAQQYGLSPDQPLSQRLDEETYGRLEAKASELGLPIEAIDPMRPWLAAVTIQVLDMVRDGFNPEAGAESVLAAEVPDEKERALETIEQQFGFFANLPEDVETDFLVSVLEEIESGTEEMRELAEDWADGDLSAIEDALTEDIREVSEELYQALLVRRNEAWVDTLVQELEGSGNDFVAVGAGHLVGEEGVPALLAARGYDVEGPIRD